MCIAFWGSGGEEGEVEGAAFRKGEALENLIKDFIRD